MSYYYETMEGGITLIPNGNGEGAKEIKAFLKAVDIELIEETPNDTFLIIGGSRYDSRVVDDLNALVESPNVEVKGELILSGEDHRIWAIAVGEDGKYRECAVAFNIVKE